MTQENKQLLLADLSAKLPYGVMLNIDYYDLQGDEKLKNRDVILSYGNIGYCSGNTNWVSVKPYLRPISSMTEEEKHELLRFGTVSLDKDSNTIDVCCVGFWNHAKVQDYLNSIHIDYRGLIPKGLAIEVTEENNPYKE